MKFRINWTENVGYYVEVEAASREEALALFEDGSHDQTPEPCGFCQVEPDSIEVSTLCLECREPLGGRHLSSCGKRTLDAPDVIPEDCQ